MTKVWLTAGAALAGSGVNVTFGAEAGIFKPVELRPDVAYLALHDSENICRRSLAGTRLHRVRDTLADWSASLGHEPPSGTFRCFCVDRRRVRAGLPQPHIDDCRHRGGNGARAGSASTADARPPRPRRGRAGQGIRRHQRHLRRTVDVLSDPRQADPARSPDLRLGASRDARCKKLKSPARMSEHRDTGRDGRVVRPSPTPRTPPPAPPPTPPH